MTKNQGRSGAFFAVAALLWLLAVSEGAGAGLVTVGGESGWTLGQEYSQITINHGDVLQFHYDSSQHDVWTVSEEDYTSCSSSQPDAVYTTGNDNIPMNTPGAYYFFCSVANHCQLGMKVVCIVQ